MAANAEMNGYDMVVALAQNLANSQLETLTEKMPDSSVPPPPPGAAPPAGADDYPIHSHFVAPLSANSAQGVTVSGMEAPTVEIIANNEVVLTLHLAEGTVVYDDGAGQQQSLPLVKVNVSFTVDIALASVGNVNELAAPAQTKTQLNKFSSSVYTLQVMALGFEAAKLISSSSVDSADFPVNSPQYTTLTTSLANYLAAFAGAKNPYVLGYPILAKQPQQANPVLPAFAPTACEFSTTPYASNKGLSTLNYCLMTQNRGVPTSASRHSFATPWLTSAGLVGALIMEHDRFVAGYVVDYMLAQIKAALKISSGWSSTSQYGNPNYWNISYMNSNEDQNDGKGDTISSDGLNVYRLEKTFTNCDVYLSTGPDISFRIEGYIDQYVKEQQFMGIPGMYQNLGEAEYKQPWKLLTSLSIGVDGKFILTTASGDETNYPGGIGAVEVIIEPNAGFLETIGDWFANLFTGGDAHTVEEHIDEQTQQMVTSMTKNFTTAVAQDLDVLANQFVLPAGDVIYYNLLDFNAAKDVLANIAGYK